MKKKWLVTGGIGCLAVILIGAVILVIAAFFASRAINVGKIKTFTEKKLTQATGNPVSIASMDFSLFPLPTVEAKQIVIGKRNASSPSMALKEVVIRPKLLPLITGTVSISRVELVGLDVSMERDRRGNWRTPVKIEQEGKKSSKTSSGLAVHNLVLKSSRIRYTDRTLTAPDGKPLFVDFKNIEGSWKYSLFGGSQSRVEGDALGGHVSIDFKTSGSGFKAIVKIKSANAGQLRPLLWSYAKIAPYSGNIDLETTAEGKSSNSFKLSVKTKLSNVSTPGFGSSSSAYKPVPVNADLEAQGQRNGSNWSFPSLKAALPHTNISGTGRISSHMADFSISTKQLDNRDLPALMGLIGMAPIQGLSIEGKTPLSVNLSIPSGRGSLKASGKASIARLKLTTLTANQIEAPFSMTNGILTISTLTFKSYNGQQRGKVVMNFNRSPIQYSILTNMNGLDVNRALSANTAAKNTLYGTASVKGNVKGKGFDAGSLKNNLNGNADISVQKGTIKNFPLLAAINKLVKVTSGRGNDTNFDSLTGSFVIGGGRAHSNDILMKAGELKVKAKGDINFNLTLNMSARAVFTVKKSRELVSRVSALRNLQNRKGRIVIPLRITGPVSSPAITPDINAGNLIQKELENKVKGKFKGKDLLNKILGK